MTNHLTWHRLSDEVITPFQKAFSRSRFSEKKRVQSQIQSMCVFRNLEVLEVIARRQVRNAIRPHNAYTCAIRAASSNVLQ